MQRKEGFFKGLKNFKIYYQSWLPDKKPAAVLLLCHGYGGHGGRFSTLAEYLLPKGYAVYALDLRGHGRSDGERLVTDNPHDYIDDLKTFFDIVRKENPAEKIFLLGHSMGSFIALLYAVEYQKELAGLIVTGSGLTRPGDPPLPAPKPGQPFDLSFISSNPEVLKRREEDPLVYHGPVPAVFPMGNAPGKLYGLAPELKLPMLIMAGNDVHDGKNSRLLYERVGSADRTLKLYDGLRHDILSEPERYHVMADLAAWLKSTRKKNLSLKRAP
ncbi:MAG TPA: lysophospholipase [Dehalococcoidales bacterium]|nr:lysophospholipase [Dehalococcoidales bacterium]